MRGTSKHWRIRKEEARGWKGGKKSHERMGAGGGGFLAVGGCEKVIKREPASPEHKGNCHKREVDDEETTRKG